VVAASVGGLRTAVADGSSGVLVDGHDPDDYARVLAELAGNPMRRAALGRGAIAQAARFGWGATAAGMLDVYADALHERTVPVTLAANR
jgi:D-inositol-3-phosphate glycosyltransferase